MYILLYKLVMRHYNYKRKLSMYVGSTLLSIILVRKEF
jgi:hypothetical protein